MSGIYIHIPFCRQACNYCNFHFATSLLKKEAMLAAINKEIELTAAGNTWPVNTIYFGGGTPSLLEVEEVSAVLRAIRSAYQVAGGAEITLEANPDDLTEEKLRGWKEAGINRLSIGVQSFFEEDLQWMNRAHNAVQAKEGLQLALQYFDNITMDLIYGTPGLTNDKWQQNVETALSLKIPHLSCYALTVEPRTPLDKLIRQHKKDDVNPDIQSEQFLLLMGWLRAAGYEHYEISNFARPGFRSRHNSSYWQGKSYVGIGPSAHSFNGAERRWNIANNQQYIESIEKGILPMEKELLTAVQRQNESIMISLRTIEGISLNSFSEEAAQQLLKAARKYINQGLVIYEPGCLRLTDEGKLYADGIAADLFFDVQATV
ncbi:radical SAM family heme chaperone HemW [Niabella sp. CJ426]|uniref:radical SAM family heme chaperone HemW n=1 Tax=Niabella sp. CJ426 TaxID=3393740 RepID=UPI003D078AE6